MMTDKTDTNRLIVDDKEIATDTQGYLKNYQDWNEQVARAIAIKEAIQLTDAHWQLILFERNFYQQFETTPAIRVLVKALKTQLGEQYGNSIYLQTLFPKGPALQLAKLAGLPRPAKCL